MIAIKTGIFYRSERKMKEGKQRFSFLSRLSRIQELRLKNGDKT